MSVTGTATAMVEVSGTAANVNAALATLSYQGMLDFSGGDVLSVTAIDGSFFTQESVTINVVSISAQATNLQAQIAALQSANVLSATLVTTLDSTITLQGNSTDLVRVAAFLKEVSVLETSGILSAAQASALLVSGDALLLGLQRYY